MEPMSFELIEEQALGLSAEDRARLACELLDSIDNLKPDEIEGLWLKVAELRAQEIDRGTAVLVEGNEVARKARALVR